MLHGENAHAHGLLVLHTEHWRTLFGVRSCDEEPNITVDLDRAGRLQAHAVPKALLSRVDDASRREALEQVVHRATGEMCELRERDQSELSYSLGLRFERCVQSVANAYSALDELGPRAPGPR